jgi:hypothetical protein
MIKLFNTFKNGLPMKNGRITKLPKKLIQQREKIYKEYRKCKKIGKIVYKNSGVKRW